MKSADEQLVKKPREVSWPARMLADRVDVLTRLAGPPETDTLLKIYGV